MADAYPVEDSLLSPSAAPEKATAPSAYPAEDKPETPAAYPDADLADPEKIRERYFTDETFKPSEDQFKLWHEYEHKNKAPIGQRIYDAAAGFLTLPKQAWDEMSQEADRGKPTQFVQRLGASAPQAIADLGLMAMTPAEHLAWLANPNTKKDLAGWQAHQYNVWKQKQELARTEALTNQNPSGSTPFSATSQIMSMGVPIGGLKYLKGPEVAAVPGKTLAQSAVEAAAKPAAKSTGENLASAAANATTKTGEVLKTIGAAPRHLVEKAAAEVVGPDLADRAAGAVETLGAFHNPVVRTIAAAEGVGSAAQKVGQIGQAAVEAGSEGPFGRMMNMAKNPNSGLPNWVRWAAASWPGKALEGGKNLAVSAGKGAAVGAGVGAGINLASDEDPVSGATFGALMGAGFGAANAGEYGKAQTFARRVKGLTSLMRENIADGVTPETLAKVPDAVALAASDARFLGVRAPDGRPVKVRFIDNAQVPAENAGASGFYSPDKSTFFINADHLQNPAEWGTIFHEFGHPLFESEVVNRPELKRQIDAAITANGADINQGKLGYAANLLNQSLKDKGVDPTSTEYAQALQDWVTQKDADSAARFNDPNHWFYSEVFGDVMRRALGTDKAMFDYGGAFNHAIRNAGLRGDVAGTARNFLRKMKIGTDSVQFGQTVIPGFEKVVDDPSLVKAARGLVKAQRDYLPGLTKPVAQEVKLSEADMGGEKAPFYKDQNGQAVNPYGMQVVGKDGKPKFVPFTRRQQVQMAKTERKALKQYIQPGQRVDKLPDAFYQDPNIMPWTKAAAKQVEDAIAQGTGLEGHYHRLNAKNSTETGDWKSDVQRTLGNTVVSWQEFQPMKVFQSKAGKLLVDAFSLAALRQKAALWAQRSGPLSLERWGGDLNQFFKDVEQYNANHAAGLPGDANNLGVDKRNVINAFLYGRNTANIEANPLRATIRGADRQGIVRSLRLDRLETLQPHEAGTKPNYDKGVLNMSPAQRPVVEVVSADGKKYKMTYDGEQDFSAIGKGKIGQYTALEDIPGVTTKGSTTYTPSLEKGGYKIGQPRQGNQTVQEVADAYLKSAGITEPQHSGYADIDENLSKKVADWYQNAEHAPDDPTVKQAYQAFAKETVDQWNAITAAGVTMEPWTKKGQPYADSKSMAADVRDNKHLWFFPTEGGYGSTEVAKHPLLEPSGIVVNGKDLPVNDVFRAVHDYFGHAKDGYSFGPRGELNAFMTHAGMFSDTARPAMAAETMGQNSWVNYGSHLRDAEGKIPAKGEPGHLPITERPYAEQKATVLPADLLKASRSLQASPAQTETPEFKKWFGDSKVVDAGGKPLVVYRGDRLGKHIFTGREDKSNYIQGNIFFSSEPAIAAGYAANNRRWKQGYAYSKDLTENDGLYRTFLSMQKPLIVDAKGEGWDSIPVKSGSIQIDDLAAEARKRGYDGLIVKNVVDQYGPSTQFAVFKPEQIKSAISNQGTFDAGNPDIRFSPAQTEEKSPFYSQLKKVVESKFTGKEMPAAQLAAILRNPQNQVKADELKWTGLDDFLSSKIKEGKRVSREEIDDYLAANQVQLKEVTKGVPQYSAQMREWLSNNGYEDYSSPPWGDIRATLNLQAREATNREQALLFYDLHNEAYELSHGGGVDETKFENYQLPGGSAYREILFTLPVNESKRFNIVPNAEETEYAGKPRVDVIDTRNGLVKYTGDDYGAAQWIRAFESDNAHSAFKSSHWDEPNVLAHTRVNDRVDSSGKPGLFLEEVQSDFLQAHRAMRAEIESSWVAAITRMKKDGVLTVKC